MKIAIFLRAREIWGAETTLITLLKSPKFAACEIHVFLPPDSPFSSLVRPLPRVVLRQHDFADLRSLRHGSLSRAGALDLVTDGVLALREAWRNRSILRGFDVVLAFGLWEAFEIGLAARLAGVPMVFDFHVTFEGSMGKRAIGHLLRLPTGVVTPAAATIHQAGLPRMPNNVCVIPRPVHLPKEFPLSGRIRDGARLRVGIFGQIEERKQVLELLREVEHQSVDVDFLVMGFSPEGDLSDYEQRVRDLCLQNGWDTIPRGSDVLEVMSSCDVVVNCSRTEAFGRTIVEGALLGLVPVVLSGAGPEEIVAQLGFGHVEPDLPGVATRLAQLRRDKAHGPIAPSSWAVRGWREAFSPEEIGARYFSSLQKFARGITEKAK